MQKAHNQAKYYQLKEYLKEEMLMGRIKPGDPIPSENELAARFSLSRHTIRKAISMLINEGFLKSEHGRGTFCLDRSKKRSTSKLIGVITTYISEYIFPDVIKGIEGVLSRNGYSMLLKNTDNDIDKESDCLREMLEKNVEGLIIEPTKSALFPSNLKIYKALDSHHIPYVFIHGQYRKLEEKAWVMLDDTLGMQRVVNYLLSLGHRNIIGIFKADDMQGLNRHKGFEKAFADFGLALNPEHVIWFYTENKKTKPVSAVRELLRTGIKIDAVACYNDEIAFAMVQLFIDMGLKVPEDISVTGFDDSYLSEYCPVKLTSMVHPKEQLGEIAAELLLQLLSDHNPKNQRRQKVIVPELKIKGSCQKRIIGRSDCIQQS